MSKWGRRFGRLLAGLCSAAICVQTAPAGAFQRLDADGSKQDFAAASASQSVAGGDPYVVGEDSGKREESVKYFRLSDGSYLAAAYAEPVHYWRDGRWEEIDNTLVETPAETETETAYLQNTAGPLQVKIPQHSGAPVSVGKDGYTIRFELLGQQPAVVQVRQPEESRLVQLYARADALLDAPQPADSERLAARASLRRVLQDEERPVASAAVDADIAAMDEAQVWQAIRREWTRATKVNAQATYANVLPGGIDLVYDVTGGGMKESLVLARVPAQTAFAFSLYTDGLTASLCEDGRVEFLDDGMVVMEIAAPVMWDAAGAHSTRIAVSLSQTEEGYRYTLTPDRAWLTAKEREYPVTIDPTIPSDGEVRDIDDATVVDDSTAGLDYAGMMSYYSAYNNAWLFVGDYTYSGQRFDMGALLRIELPEEITESSRILDARMYLYYYRAGLTTCSDGIHIEAHAVSGDWSAEDAYILKGLPAHDPEAIGVTVVNDGAASGDLAIDRTPIEFDVTSAAQDWIAGVENRGVLLRSSAPGQGLARFYASTNGTVGSDPVYVIRYRDMKGVEDTWTYTTMPIGRFGSVAVNTYNGNVVAVQDIVGIDGNLMPVGIQLVYSSSGYSDATIGGAGGVTVEYPQDTGLPYNWRTNYNLRILYAGDTLRDAGYWFYFIDADGTDHYIAANRLADGTYDKYHGEDEDGLGLTFEFVETAEQAASTGKEVGYTLTDKNDTVYQFTGAGWLRSITDANGNAIQITYQNGGTSGRISRITDGAGRDYVFTYSTDIYSGAPAYDYPMLVSITSPDGRQNRFNYKAEGTEDISFYEIQYPSVAGDPGSSSICRYSNNKLQTIQDLQYNYYTTISYQNGRAYRIHTISDTYTRIFTFEYGHNATTITDQTGRQVTYQFNNYGQTIGVVNHQSGQAQYYQYGAPGGTEQGDAAVVDGTQNKLLTASVVTTCINDYLSDSWLLYGGEYGRSDDAEYRWNGLPTTRVIGPAGSGPNWQYQDIRALGDGTFTASVYLSTNGAELDRDGVYLSVDIRSRNNEDLILRSVNSDRITCTQAGEWVRASVTFTLTANEFPRLHIGSQGTTGTFWISAPQLEEGEFANSYNLVHNPTLSLGTAGWSVFGPAGNRAATVVTEGGQSALRAVGDGNEWIAVEQRIEVSGEAGDVFRFGGWAKAHSLATGRAVPYYGQEPPDVSGETTFRVRLTFLNGNNEPLSSDAEATAEFTFGVWDWQMVGGQAIAPGAYDAVKLDFDYDYNDNTALFNRAYVYKESYGQSYTYDKDGNVVSSVDLARTEATFAYQDDQLSKLMNPSGSRYFYTYDLHNNLTYALTSGGQRYAVEYDRDDAGKTNGNPTQVTITGENINLLEDGKTYTILEGYAGLAMFNMYYSSTMAQVVRWDPTDVRQQYIAHHISGDDWEFEPATVSLSGYRLTVESGSDGATVTAQPYQNSSTQRFRLEYSALEGAYRIKTVLTGGTKCLDSSPDEESRQLTSGDYVKQQPVDNGSEGQRWYFIEVTSGAPRMQSSATYSTDGNYLKSVTDGLGNTVTYETDPDSGELQSVTDPLGNETTYTYDALGRPVKVENDGQSVTYGYVYDRLASITSANGTTYSLGYNSLGQRTTTKVGNQELSSNTYNTRNLLTEVEYGNGDTVYYRYDELDRVVGISYTGSAGSESQYLYGYDAAGQLGVIRDRVNDQQTRYEYDMAQRLVKMRVLDGWDGMGGEEKLRVEYVYEDGTNRLERYRVAIDGGTPVEVEYSYATGTDDVWLVTRDRDFELQYRRDALNRLVSRTLLLPEGTARTTTYSYKAGTNGNTTGLLYTMSTSGESETYSYYYDANGNITAVLDKGILLAQYEYDEYNQLVMEEDRYQRKVMRYEYDSGGNLIEKRIYKGIKGQETLESTITLGYENEEWPDQVTSYNGKEITYDANGNTVDYYNGCHFIWENGRQLSGFTGGPETVTYEYNEDGLRTKKTVGSKVTEYYWQGNELVGQKSGNNVLQFLLDENGMKYGFLYNGEPYYYIFNGQGDVRKVIDGSGEEVATYTYDAWGDITSQSGSMASINPIRYRGYYYDEESTYYYLQSRYYDPYLGRFVNADTYVSTGQGITGTNMYAYCANNPVNFVDPSGEFLGALIGGIIGGIGGAIAGGISAAIKGEDILAGAASGAIGGAAGGAIAGTVVEAFVSPATSIGSAALIGAAGGAVGGFASSTISQTTNYYFNNGSMDGFEMDWTSVAISTGTGALFNAGGSAFGQSQALFYNYEPIVSVVAGSTFTIANGVTDITVATVAALAGAKIGFYIAWKTAASDVSGEI